MSAKLLLAAINTLKFANMDMDMMGNIQKSLDMIMDFDTFPGTVQEAAFCKSIEVKEAMSICEALEFKEANALKKMDAAMNKFFEKQRQEDGEGSSDNDKLVRLMIRAEEDGTLSFTFRDTRWDWNHNTNVWDVTPIKK